jgi:hypothetical protein
LVSDHLRRPKLGCRSDEIFAGLLSHPGGAEARMNTLKSHCSGRPDGATSDISVVANIGKNRSMFRELLKA